jgi:hypothetical protein
MTALESVTLVSALVGATTGIGGLLLGIANRQHQLRTSDSKLRVIPKLALPGPADEMVRVTYLTPDVEQSMARLKTYACVEVTNLGAKPVAILEVGFLGSNGQRIPWRDPTYLEPNAEFPLRLAPDETGAAYRRIYMSEQAGLHPVAYVLTDCGECFEGSSPIMDDLVLSRTDSSSPGPCGEAEVTAGS